MRILIVSQMGLNSPTGVTTYYKTLSSEFSKLRYEVEIITPADAPKAVQTILKAVRKCCSFLRIDFLDLLASEAFYFFSIYFAVRRIRRSDRFDIIHGQDPSSTVAALFAANFDPVGITTCHYNFNPVNEREKKYRLSKFQVTIVTKWFRFLFSKSSNYIFVSAFSYNKSKFLLGADIKYKIIHNGSKFGKEFQNSSRASGSLPIRIANVGTLEDRKNQVLLIKAAEFIARSGLNFLISIYGTGPRMSQWIQLVQELNLGSYVRFAGFDTEVKSSLSNEQLYVHTALIESCSLAIIESFSVGLPVLALATGGTPELFEENSQDLISPNITPEMLAELIISRCTTENLQMMHVRQHQFSSSRFSIENMINQTLGFYEEAVRLRWGTVLAQKISR